MWYYTPNASVITHWNKLLDGTMESVLMWYYTYNASVVTHWSQCCLRETMESALAGTTNSELQTVTVIVRLARSTWDHL
jgi:hypothetical protein